MLNCFLFYSLIVTKFVDCLFISLLSMIKFVFLLSQYKISFFMSSRS